MALIIVISTGDFKYVGMYCHCRSVKEKVEKWPLGLSDLYHDYLISNDCIQHSGKISIRNT